MNSHNDPIIILSFKAVVSIELFSFSEGRQAQSDEEQML